MNVYSVKDTKARSFSPPFFQLNHTTALRAFALEVNRADPQNVVYNNPDDFEIYFVGTFDPDTGVITGQEPDLIGTALKLAKEAK